MRGGGATSSSLPCPYFFKKEKQMKKQINSFTKTLGKRGKELDKLFKAERTPENSEAFVKLMGKILKEATKDDGVWRPLPVNLVEEKSE
jgi:hypothetical protein